MIKLIVKYLLTGITWGCFFLVANIILFDLAGSEHLQFIFDNFTPIAIGFIAVSIGFISTSIVYETERLSLGLKLVIHVIVGVSVVLIVGFRIGIFSSENPSVIIINVIVNALILFAVWVGHYFKDKRRVEKINQRLQERNSTKTLDTE